MTPYQNTYGTALLINFHLLGSALCAASAYLIWPEAPQWWGFYVVSILLWVGALATLIEALKAMHKLYKRDKALADYMAQGNKPKSSKMASSRALKSAGVIDE